METWLGWLSGFLFLAAYVPYVRGVRNGSKRPMKSSWFIWAALDTITCASMLAQGSATLQIAASVLGSWTVFFLALRRGKPGLNRLDLSCLAAAALGVALWAVLDDPRLGLAMSLAVTFLGSLPTFASAWRCPKDENGAAWGLYFASSALAVLAAPAGPSPTPRSRSSSSSSPARWSRSCSCVRTRERTARSRPFFSVR